jgi:hypothetical protein
MDEDGCYVELYFYDKLSSLRSLDMPDPSVKHVRGSRFGFIRHETCLILRDNLLPHPANCSSHSVNCSMHSTNRSQALSQLLYALGQLLHALD